ncbi:radical SAM protein [Candidatus Sumerlaeota bacterium]|nr:radical SAM protein [Candidatus Sumerlaeota bacterium]
MNQVRPDPGYLALARSGELERRAQGLRLRIRACDLCPRRCGVDRSAGALGYCGGGERACVASHNAHHGEEPPISGTRGSGTVFFAHCTMRCKYCQNYPISQLGHGREMSDLELARCFLDLQKRGCHNLNLVTPTHYSHAFLSALIVAVEEGFRLPIVYNTSGYESVEILRILDGVVDVYMPDMKYSDPDLARRYSDAPDYVERNVEAVREMQRQVGDLVLDDEGAARKGVLVRHLVMPGDEDDSIDALRALSSEISPTAYVSLMSQYFPAYKAVETPPLDRRVDPVAYGRVVEWMASTDLRGWIQPLPAI